MPAANWLRKHHRRCPRLVKYQRENTEEASRIFASSKFCSFRRIKSQRPNKRHKHNSSFPCLLINRLSFDRLQASENFPRVKIRLRSENFARALGAENFVSRKKSRRVSISVDLRWFASASRNKSAVPFKQSEFSSSSGIFSDTSTSLMCFWSARDRIEVNRSLWKSCSSASWLPSEVNSWGEKKFSQDFLVKRKEKKFRQRQKMAQILDELKALFSDIKFDREERKWPRQ